MIDSAAIQHAVQTATNAGTQFLPGAYQLFAPGITAIVTLITAAIIRAVEKRNIKRKHKKECQELVQAYLSKDTGLLAEKISELKSRNI
jgi:hypothetical protein